MGYNGPSGGDELVEAVLGLNRAAPLLVISLGEPGKTLNGRARGKEFFEKIVHRMDELPADTVLPLSFAQVEFLDVSCADEIVCRLAKRIGSGELRSKFFVLMDLDETVKENIKVALEAADLSWPYDDNGRIELLGRLSQPLRETYELALHKGVITTHELQRTFAGLKLTAASNRLVSLEKAGLLYRISETGRQYTYQAVA